MDEVVVYNEIRQYCLDKYMAIEEFPFGKVPICYKLNGKIWVNYNWKLEVKEI